MHPNPKFPSLQDLKTTTTLSEFYDCLEMIEAEFELAQIRTIKDKTKSGNK